MYAISDSNAYPSEREAVQRLAPQPKSIRDTGLNENFLGDLLCKHLHDAGVLDLSRLAERLALTGTVVEEVLQFLRKQGRVEVLGQTGGTALRYGLTDTASAAQRRLERAADATSDYIARQPLKAAALAVAAGALLMAAYLASRHRRRH